MASRAEMRSASEMKMWNSGSLLSSRKMASHSAAVAGMVARLNETKNHKKGDIYHKRNESS